MKNKLCMLFAIVLLLVGGCNEKSQNYFAGTILEITDNYFIVSPDDSILSQRRKIFVIRFLSFFDCGYN